MFSSNPSLEIPSSVHVPPAFSSFYDLDINGDYFIHHEHNGNPVVSADCFFNSYKSTCPPASPPLQVTSNTQDLIYQQQIHEGSLLQYSDDYDDLLESVVYPCKKKTVNSKKDGHSKIFTAQGPRDRRVRLSIDIARKFFELQNLLGFDKASKTLDWLFTKSKAAINELVQETRHSSSSNVPTDQCELAFFDDDEGENKEKTKVVNGKIKKITQKNKSVHVDLAREQSRAEARIRARERTKEKLRIKTQQFELKKFPDEYSSNGVSSSNLKHQSCFWGRIESQSDYNGSIVEKRFF